MNNKMVIADELKMRFKDFITDRSGIYFKDHDLLYLQEAIAARAKSCGFNSLPAYYTYLTTSENKENEFRELLNLLTVNHTYFFRDEFQFKALKEKILPQIIQKKKHSLRIWSAGCSTGEEPYSLAIAIREIIPDIAGWDIRIIATDASEAVLEKARRAIFRRNSLQLVGKEYLEKYFISHVHSSLGSGHELSDTIKNMVSFSFHNLIEDDFPAGMDIIFCRNVIIYFELETMVKILHKFYHALDDEGYLFLGYSESLQFITDKFKMQESEGAIFYRKALSEAAPISVGVKSVEKEAQKILEDLSWAELKAEEKEAGEKINAEARKDLEPLLAQAIKDIFSKQYDSALSLVDKALKIDKSAVEPHYLAAEIYSNQGKFGESKEKLREGLKLNPLFTAAHYLLGLIYLEEGKPEEAKQGLKKALYLDKNFPLAHFSLANIYKSEGRFADAMREYRNTLNILAKDSPGDIIAYSQGLNAATLMSVCRDNIERLKLEQNA